MQIIVATRVLILFFVAGVFQAASGQQHQLTAGMWSAYVERQDGNKVAFTINVVNEKGIKRIFIINDTEQLEVRDIVQKGDSFYFRMPVFESEFSSRLLPDGSLQGVWIKGTAAETQYWNFRAFPGRQSRFPEKLQRAQYTISGKWAMLLTRPATGYTRKALASLVQSGNRVTGTVLTPSGDYRFLEGIISGDSLKLSTFDGAHAYLFIAKADADGKRLKGFFYSGFAGVEEWSALKDDNAQLSGAALTGLKQGYERLNFTFPDIDGNPVSVNDKRFKNKVVIIQIMGSWCPNCMDETKFLSDYYNNSRDRDVEIVSLAYEYSVSFERSQKSLRRFQKTFNVQYPMLITGVSVSDTLRTQKTLPQITDINVFPTTLFIGKDGRVKKIHTGFYGPGSGVYFEQYKKDFFETVNALLKE